MSNEVFAEIVGFRDLQDAIRRIKFSDKDTQRIMRNAFKFALTPGKREAKRLAPKESGALRKAIERKASRSGLSGSLYVSSRQNTTKNKPTNYAHLVEFGTRHSRKKSFLHASLDNKKTEITDRLFRKAGERFKKLWEQRVK